MRDYGKVSPQFWTGRTGKQLRGHHQAQVVALYLMTSPHANMIGVYHVPILYVAHETGMGLEGATEGLRRCSEVGFCTYDMDTETVFVIEMAAHQIGDELKPNDNRRLNVIKQFQAIGEKRIRAAFFDRYGDAYGLPSEGASKPLRSQKQEQEKKQEQEQEAADAVPHDQIIAAFHEALPMCPKVKSWTDKRKGNLRARWREDAKRQSLDYWQRFFRHCAASEFLTGRAPPRDENGEPFLASLDWLVLPENFAKVIEGKYHKRGDA